MRKTLLVWGDLDLQPGHVERFEQLGCAVRRLPKDAPPAGAGDALASSDLVIFNNVDVNPFLERFRTVEFALLAATGYEFIDLDRANELGISLANLPDYASESVVEYMLWAALRCLRPLEAAAARPGAGDWGKSGLCGRGLAGLVAGIVGYGAIGSRLAGQLEAAGMQVQVTARRPGTPAAVYRGWGSPRPQAQHVLVPLAELARTSDVVFVCCSADPTSIGAPNRRTSRLGTPHLINGDFLRRMKDDAVLISISPNSVIDLCALAGALKDRRRMLAVLDLDPIPPSHPLLSCENALITPHVAFLTFNTLQRRVEKCIETIQAYLSGGPVHYLTEKRA
jgi:glycerate dehydrogenase